ncbi:DNA polymerase-3 subunit gamma/tau [Arthrobacter pigmenti]|uniref:DNA polymerase III subunit gamma/tau n=1 Tax=Arthrobacter pigmenti TaxID=271432 RepID=A0A846RKB7_9MICC|nr:DNA polymerase-3 subunit gamma/tau [Arthrobacter pigmenti]
MSTALYRRYRPETFSDVIGQEHVTEPLMTAISKDRVNHAYLFSGPRGCGKTTSARILARCLNCAQGPTPVPCGTCDSCVALARNGSGSLDVIEIDAASHGGVDDARDLRERATFAPVRDRYKIFIIDEAHMVTSAGFNALLKIVEEPPEHIKFIFATTEPDKVIGTIRSRTHHYPFRLVPPEPLMAYLELLCNQENIPVAPGVLSLVVRAGGGSVRDSLSVLDQLMAGAGSSGLDYELAVSLLGYTHASLLDDVVDAVAADDSATVFGAVDRVIQTGHDPRRFVEDLLERFRDLIIVNAVPDAAASILRGVPEDQLNRMRTQAQQLGRSELSRAADITNTALTEMTGATSPRLHLELLCARILLPAADQSEQGTLARVDRIERRLSYASGLPETSTTTAPGPVPATPSEASATPPEASAAPSAAPDSSAASASSSVPPSSRAGAAPSSVSDSQRESAGPSASDSQEAPVPAEKLDRTTGPAQEAGAADWGGGWGLPPESSGEQPPDAQRASQRASAQESTPPSGDQARSTQQSPVQQQGSQQSSPAATVAQQGDSQEESASQRSASQQQAAPSQPAAANSAQASTSQPPAPQGNGQIEMIRRAWPEIMDELASIKRSTWLNVNTDAKPRAFSGNQLTLVFASQGNALGFQRGQHMDNLKQAINKVLGLNCNIEAIHDGAAAAGEPDPKVPTSRDQPADGPGAAPVQSADQAKETTSSVDEAWGLPSSAAASSGTPSPAESPSDTASSSRPSPAESPSHTASSSSPSPAESASDTRPTQGEEAPPAGSARTETTWAPDETPVPSQPSAVVSGAGPAAEGTTEREPVPAVAPGHQAQDKTAHQAPPASDWSVSEPLRDPDDPGPQEPSFEDEPPSRPSRYQQLLDEAARAEAARPQRPDRGAVDLSYVDDVPSADDETLEESGLVGRRAIERILNGRLIEERSLDQ